MSKDYIVLGVNMGLHDSSAAILVNGEMVAMGEQERFSRHKRATDEAPIDAVKFCLERANIRLDQVDVIALGSSQKLLDEWHGLTEEEIKNRIQLDDPNRLFPRDVFKYDELPEIVSIPHHVAHAASAYYLSGFENSAVLVVDNRGERTATTLFHGVNGKLEFIEEYPVTESLGLYYRTASQYAGLCGKYRNVGKLMGLAPYGKPIQTVPLQVQDGKVTFEQLEDISDLRGIEIPPKRTEQLLNYYKKNCYPYAIGLKDDVMAYSNFAASIQQSLEKALLHYCSVLKEKTGSEYLSIAGGVGLNCSGNGVLAASGLYKKIFVQPVAGDAGVSIGAAFEIVAERRPDLIKCKAMTHPYFGTGFSDEEVLEAARESNLEFEVYDREKLVDEVAKMLNDYKVIGWFQGREEIGPRALGGRSILGNPKDRETLIRINNIKNREIWRPLAPSVLEERFHEYFRGPQASEFMIIATTVHEFRRHEIPAVVHIDGTARPQIVKKDTNEIYWNLIKRFGELSGTPILVNTSFNTDDEPIVHTPQNAIKDFLETDMDGLVVNNVLFRKKQ